MIKYVKETLYHFNCSKCFFWWSISDMKEDAFNPKLSCPKCGVQQKTKRAECINTV